LYPNQTEMKIFLVLFLMTIFLSCQPTKEKKEPQKAQDESNEEIHEHSSDEIQLNEGKKWKVDDSMMVYIRNMESSFEKFKLIDDNSFIQLTDTLLSNINLLTSNCTMKGQAHDELHKWLVPYIDLVNKLAESKVKVENTQLHLELKESFATFNQFFE
jgi:hypothetical protein